jgi:short-subunit dehydrogenase
MAVSPKKVGEIAVRQTFKGKLLIIPGFLPKIMAFFLQVMPRRVSTSIYDKLGKQ